MDKDILTAEEIAERNELFEYEMTQVLLSLREEYENADIIGSPLEHIDLAAEDIDKRIEYAPLEVEELEAREHNIPSLIVSAAFTPLSEIRAEVGVQPIPDSQIDVEYNPFQADLENIPTHDVPTVSKIGQFTPFAASEIPIAFEQDIPVAAINIDFHPSELGKPSPEILDVPDIADIKSYTPMSLNSDAVSRGEAPEIPNIAQGLNFVPGKVEVKLHDVECPDLGKIPQFIPINAPNFDKADVAIPDLKSAISFEPSEIAVNLADISVPEVKSAFNYMPTVETIEALPKIEIPVLGVVPEFTPIKEPAYEAVQISIPKTSVDVKAMDKVEIATPELPPEFELAVENAAPKDFYSMWMDM